MHNVIKKHVYALACLAISLGAIAHANSAIPASSANQADLTAHVTTRAGATHVVTMVGVGCSQSMCSRSIFKASDSTGAPVAMPIASIAKIQTISENEALFVLKDGSHRRLSLVKDFRVLYVGDSAKRMENIQMSDVKSVEFSASIAAK